jgi:sigma-E factor negative regulatory protein RseA
LQGHNWYEIWQAAVVFWVCKCAVNHLYPNAFVALPFEEALTRMTEQTPPQTPAESLSALMDNQASELELMRLLKACDSDPELKATWARYQITSASLRGDLPGLAPTGFAARLSAALDAEETYTGQSPTQEQLKQEQPRLTSWWQQLGRVAVAASVAGALVVGVQQ